MTKTEKEYQDHIQSLEQQIQLLKEQVDFLTRKLYGTKSEKTSALNIEGQMSLFDEVEACADPAAHEPTMIEIKSHLRRRKYEGQRAELVKDLPHKKVLHTLDDSEKYCDECGGPLTRVGEEFVRTEVQFIPAKLQVIDHYRETYECRSCRTPDHKHMEKAPIPAAPIQHSLASASTIAWLIHQKFEMGIPLYRMEKEWESMGLKLTRATMANWLLVVYRDWLVYIAARLKHELLSQGYLHVDETRVQVLQEAGRKNTTDSYMWVYCSIKDAKHPIRYFEYQPGRSGKYPEAFLKGYHGYIHTDAYAGYNNVKDVKRCMCFTHLRRAFVDSLSKDQKDPKNSIAGEAILRLNKLFEKEAELADLPPESRYRERLDREKKLLEDFFAWSKQQESKALPKSKLAEAFRYGLNNKDCFYTYLDDGNCSISNSLAENCIRPFVIGRKNWLFAGSPRGAAASAAIYTLVETAKANQLNPLKYMQLLLKEMPGSAFLEYPDILDDFLPWNPYVQQICS